jgi:hypothetical protein
VKMCNLDMARPPEHYKNLLTSIKGSETPKHVSNSKKTLLSTYGTITPIYIATKFDPYFIFHPALVFLKLYVISTLIETKLYM